MKNNYLFFIKVLMKLSFYGIFIQVFFLNVLMASMGSAQGYKSLSEVYIELDTKDLSIKGLFSEIESHTSFEFNYDDKSIDKRAKVKLSATRQSVEDLLVSAGRSASLHFRRINNNISVQRANSKTVHYPIVEDIADVLINGKITDENGEGLPGASIIIKSTNQGTTTDIDGRFSIEVPEDGVLLISFVGYTAQEVEVSNRSVIDVQLQPDVSTLTEVIVTGYGEKDTRKITSSIATVNSDRIERVPMATFDNILQGSAPGLLVQSGTGQPGRASSVNIRGVKSINGSSTPLYILDGIAITSGDFAAINPNDIASVSVLKDAAATQIFGSRGATGVIVITTKSGVKGKTQIEYHTYYGVSPAPQYNNGLKPVTSAELIDLQHELGIGATVGLPQETLDSLKTINTNWLDVLTRDAQIRSHELVLKGGGETTRFYVSGSYFSQEGTSIRSKLDRYSLRTKIDYDKDALSFGTNFYASYAISQDSESEGSFGRSNPFYSSLRANPYDHAIDPRTGEYALPLDLGASSTANVLERIMTNDEDRAIGKAILGIYGQYKLPFLEGLSVRSQWSADYSQRDNEDWVDPNSFRGPLSNGGQGQLFQSFERRIRFTGTNSISYQFEIGGDHRISTSLFQEFVYFSRKESELTVFGLDRIRTIAGATQGTADNGFIPEFDGETFESALSSYFGTVDYSFKDRYNLTAGLRRDGSSRFSEANRHGIFYSVGAGWIASDEQFLSSLGFINYLKLRASYGTVGNQDISGNAARAIYQPTTYNGAVGYFSGLSNPDLKWEETKKLNLGLDMTLGNGFLSMTLDVYDERTEDLFLEVPISNTTGFDDQLRNVGTLRNRGIELGVNTKNLNIGGFKWETDFNVAHNKTVVLEIFNGESFKTNDDFLIEEGKEYGLFNLVKRAGVNPANGRFLWYDIDGELTEVYDEDNAVDLGSSIPDFFGGINNTFTYKGFSLSVFLTFAQGHYKYNTPRTSLDNPTKVSRGSVSNNALKFWRKPGDITDLPDPNKVSTFEGDSGWLEDASYVRLRNVTLAYNFPSEWVSKIFVNDLRLYVQGQNIYTWTSFTGLDPENSSSTYVADYPSLSTYTVGLDVKF